MLVKIRDADAIAKAGPVFEAQQHHVQSIAIASQKPGGVQQLLKHLVVGGEADLAIELHLAQPERQRWLQSFGGESGADGNGRCRLFRLLVVGQWVGSGISFPGLVHQATRKLFRRRERLPDGRKAPQNLLRLRPEDGGRTARSENSSYHSSDLRRDLRGGRRTGGSAVGIRASRMRAC